MTDKPLALRRTGTSAAIQELGRRTVGRIEPPTRTKGIALASIFTAALFFGGFGAWAFMAPLRSAVIAPGVVKVSGDRDIVQHLEGGLVDEILVKEGDRVKAGQPLLRLDHKRTQAEISIIRGQLLSQLALEARLAAEQAGDTSITVADGAVPELADRAQFESLLAAQSDVFSKRQESLSGEIAVLDDRIAQLAEEITGIEGEIVSQETQLALVRAELADVETLLAKNLVRKPRVLALQRAVASVEGMISVNRAEIARARQQISEAEERKLQARRRLVAEVTTQKQAVQDRIFELRQRLKAYLDVRERQEVKALRDGTVIDLQVRNSGVVIQAGQRLMEILPDNQDLIIEAQVKPADIDIVRNGLKARVRMTAFDMRRMPPLDGVVTQISADRLVDTTTNLPYFRAFIELDEASREKLDGQEILPGMSAEALIETGESTLATYLFGPIVNGLNRSLREN